MSGNLGWSLALRFVRSRRKGALTRFMSFASTCGIAIGVFAAIVGLSAMNGFEYELDNRVRSLIPSAQLNPVANYFHDVADIERLLRLSPDILGVSPVVESNAVLSANRAFAPLLLLGIDPKTEREVVSIQRFTNVNFDCLDAQAYPDLSSACALDNSFNPIKAPSKASQAIAAGQVEVMGTAEWDNYSVDSQTGATAGMTSGTAWSEQAKSEMGESPHIPRLIIGSGVARKLKVGVGDTITIVTLPHNNERSTFRNGNGSNAGRTTSSSVSAESAAQSSLAISQVTRALKTPTKQKAQVIGIVHVGGQLDSSLAFMHIDEVKEMAQVPGANSIHIRTSSLEENNNIIYAATRGKIKESAYLTTWVTSHGKLYHDIQMVRQIMFVSMFLVLGVACFNIISNLIMMVGEKRREIAILLTMGMKPRFIVRVFALMGLISGGYGALIGLILGVGVSLVMTPLTSSFKDIFGFSLLNEDVYFINFIPCVLKPLDVVIVMASALVLSLLAALYPAWRASKVKPAQELNL